ncbi:MAG: hypothetical protein Kow00124_23180 [Anaerolineae bacterium]
MPEERRPHAGVPAARLAALSVVLLVGAALRVAPLTDNRFHPDEALFTTLARLIADGSDPLLASTSLLVDKPPLFYYTLAAGVSLSWGSEVTARLPGLFAGVISIALTARLARLLWRSNLAALAASLFAALSPFAILFSPTAFADPLLIVWWLAALTAAAGRRPLWAGVFSACALLTKQNALFLLPLVPAVGLVQAAGSVQPLAWIGPFGVGLALPLVAAPIWDVARGEAVSFWLAGINANNPGRLARSTEVWPRAAAWIGWLRYVPGGVLAGAVAAALTAVGLIGRRDPTPAREEAAAHLIAAFGLAYLALHWLVAFPLFDRYLLPVAWIAALLVGHGTDRLAARASEAGRPAAGAALAALIALPMALPAYRAAQSAYPVGGDHGAYDGIDEVAAYLKARPEGTVVYTGPLGWTLGCYLYDAYLYLSPIAAPGPLMRDLQAHGGDGSQRYLVLPADESPIPLIEAVQAAGYQAEVALETRSRAGVHTFTVYRVAAGGR